jgi:hypothetical protein
MLRFCQTCTLLALAWPAAASAAPTVAVVGIHQASLDDADQQRAVAGIVNAIEANGRFDALAPPEVATALSGRETVVLEEGLLALPEDKLASGKNAYNQASWDDALAYLDEAVSAFESVFQGANNADDLWETQVYRGSCNLLKDPPNPTAAREAFSAAIALSPSKPLNPALFPPDVIASYGSLQKELTASKMPVQIVSSDAMAKVWLDGIEKGSTPAVVPDVVPGAHYVVARNATGMGFLRVDVKPTENGGPMSINVPLAAPSLGTASTSPVGRASQVASLYQAIGSRASGVDYVLAVGVVDTLLSVQLYDVTHKVWSRAIELPYSDESDDEAVQAVPLLLNGVGPDGTFVATAAAPAALDIGANEELALLLTAAITPKVTSVTPVPTGPVVEHKSKAGLVVGVISGLVVAAGAGAGTYLFATREPEDPNQGVVVIQF